MESPRKLSDTATAAADASRGMLIMRSWCRRLLSRSAGTEAATKAGEAVAKTVAGRGGALGSCRIEVSLNHGFFFLLRGQIGLYGQWKLKPLATIEYCFCYEVRRPPHRILN